MPIINPKTDGNEHLLEEAYPEGELESSAVRFAKVDGQDFRLEAIDPYSLWRVVPKKGEVPFELSGAYTSPSEAEAAIKAYLLAKKFKEDLARKEAEKLKEELALNGTPTNTQSESVSDKPSPQSTQHLYKGTGNRSHRGGVS